MSWNGHTHMALSLSDACSSWVGKPVERALEEAKYLLRREKKAFKESLSLVVESLLACVSALGEEAAGSRTKQAAEFIAKIGFSRANDVGSTLLQHMESLPNPIPFVEIFPSLFGFASHQLLREAFDQLQSLLSFDNHLILPVISTMIELPLTNDLKDQFTNILGEIMSAIDEADFPFLFRALLCNLDYITDTSVASRILDELSSLNHSTLVLVIETLWEVVPASPLAAGFVRKHVYDCAQKGHDPTLADICVCLVIYSTPQCKDNEKSNAWAVWLKSLNFPFNHLQSIIFMFDHNEVWSRMQSSMWAIILWAIDFSVSCGHLLAVHTDAFRTLRWTCVSTAAETDILHDAESYHFTQLQDLCIIFFRHAVGYREVIIQAFLTRSFLFCSKRYTDDVYREFSMYIVQNQPGVDGVSDGIIPQNSLPGSIKNIFIPTVMSCIAAATSSSCLLTSSVLHQHGIAHVSAVILQQLVSHSPATHSAVLSFLLEKLHSPQHVMSSTLSSCSSSSTYDRSLLQLPSSLILHRVMSSIAMSALEGSANENSLLIIVQKMIGVALHDDPLFVKVLCDGYCSEDHLLAAAEKFPSIAIPPERFIPSLFPCVPLYYFSGSSIGILLASYILKHRLTYVSKHNSHDLIALLNWIKKYITNCKDFGCVFSADIISVVAMREIKDMIPSNKKVRSKSEIFSLLYDCHQALNSSFPMIRLTEVQPLEDKSTILFAAGGSSVDNNYNAWQVSRISEKLVDVCIPCQWDKAATPLEAHKSLTDFVVGVFWIFQKVATLDAALKILSSGSDAANGSLFHINSQMSIVMALTACNSDLSLFGHDINTNLSVSDESGKNCSSSIQFWLCRTSSEYSDVDHSKLLHSVTCNSLLQSLRLAWEGALTAAILSGYVFCLATQDEDQSKCHRLFLQLIGCAVRTRYFLRQVSPSALISAEKRRRKKSKESDRKKQKISDKLETGGENMSTESLDYQHFEAVPASRKSELSELLFLHAYFIRRNIDRLMIKIPVPLLARCLGECMASDGSTGGVKEWIDYDVIHSQLCNDEFHHSRTPPIYSDYGLQLTIVLCAKFLNFDQIIPSHLDLSCVDPYLTFDEVDISAPFWSEENSSSSTKKEASTHGKSDDKALIDMYICKLFALLPLLIRRGRKLRVIEAEIESPDIPRKLQNSQSVPAESGPMLDKNGIYLFLSVLYMTMSSFFERIHLSNFSSANRIQSISGNKNISSMLFDLVAFCEKMQSIKCDQATNIFDDDEKKRIMKNDFDSYDRMIILYRIVENHALTTPDTTLCLAAVKFLLGISAKINYLEKRVFSMLWLLLKSIHECSVNSIFPSASSPSLKSPPARNVELNGKGLLSRHLQQYIAVASSEVFDFSFTSSKYTTSTTLHKACSQCKNLLVSGRSLGAKLVSKSLGGIQQIVEMQSFDGFCDLLSLWWWVGRRESSSCTATSESSLNCACGLVVLLAEAFVQYDMDNITNCKNKKGFPDKSFTEAISIADVSISRRTRKKTQRFAPDNFLDSKEKSGNKPDDKVSIKQDDVNDIQDNAKHNLPRSRLMYSSLAMMHSASQVDQDSYMSSASSSQRARRISGDNFDGYLGYLTSYLPSLILVALPSVSSESTLQCTSGPYHSFVYTMQLCCWCLDELSEIFVRNQSKSFAPFINHTVRMCKAATLAMECSISANMEWRVSAKASSCDVDWTSADYLGELFYWAALFLRHVIAFADKLTQAIMTSKDSVFPKSLSRSLPSLKTGVDKLLIKVENWKSEFNSIDMSVDTTGVDSGQWVVDMYSTALQYDTSCCKTLAHSASLSCSEVPGDKDVFLANEGDPTTDEPKQLLMMPDSNGFGVATSRSSGWGWEDSDSGSDSYDSEASGCEEGHDAGHGTNEVVHGDDVSLASTEDSVNSDDYEDESE